MDVNDHALGQDRKNVQKFEFHVAHGSLHVGRIDEDDVAGGERSKKTEIGLFDSLALERDAEIVEPRISKGS